MDTITLILLSEIEDGKVVDDFPQTIDVQNLDIVLCPNHAFARRTLEAISFPSEHQGKITFFSPLHPEMDNVVHRYFIAAHATLEEGGRQSLERYLGIPTSHVRTLGYSVAREIKEFCRNRQIQSILVVGNPAILSASILELGIIKQGEDMDTLMGDPVRSGHGYVLVIEREERGPLNLRSFSHI